jgi:hypothetical protein
MAVIEEKTKRCAHCGQEKPITMFYKDSHTKDGLQSWCKQCSNERSNKARLKLAHESFNEAVEQHLEQYPKSEQRENKAANTAIDWEQRTFDVAARIFANTCAIANPSKETAALCIEYASDFVSAYRENLTFGTEHETA